MTNDSTGLRFEGGQINYVKDTNNYNYKIFVLVCDLNGTRKYLPALRLQGMSIRYGVASVKVIALSPFGETHLGLSL